MLKKVAANMLHGLALVLRHPLVDFRWDASKYKKAFDRIERARMNGLISDEEVGETFELLGENQPKLIRITLYAVGGFFKSRLIDFSWPVSKYAPVFSQLDKMAEDRFFEDEELADFCMVLARTLEA